MAYNTRRRRDNAFKQKQLSLATISAICAIIIATLGILNFVSNKFSSKTSNNISESTHQLSDNELKQKIKKAELALNREKDNLAYYNVFKILRDEERYYDEETGFQFYVREISGYNSFLGKTDGVLCWYKLPNGEAGKMLRRRKGEAIEFKHLKRTLIAKIIDIDYHIETVTIEIKEL